MGCAFASLLAFSLLHWVYLLRVELQHLTAMRVESLSEGPLHAIRVDLRSLDPGALDVDNRVRSLHMNPTDDTFISAGDDGTVRVWDLRMPECKVSFMLRVMMTTFAADDATQD